MKMIDRIMICLIFGLVIASHIETKKELNKLKVDITELKALDDLTRTQFSAQSRINELIETVLYNKQDKPITSLSRIHTNSLKFITNTPRTFVIPN